MNGATVAFVKRFAIAMITASRIKYATIACATLDVATITRVQVMNLVSTINAEVSTVSRVRCCASNTYILIE